MARLTLDAPSGPSRINVESAREWLEALREADADPDIRVILYNADGAIWITGWYSPAFRNRRMNDLEA